MSKRFDEWTFGVEFEFAVAYLREPQLPDPSETRTVWFSPTQADYTRALDDLEALGHELEPDTEDQYHWIAQWTVVAEHIKDTLEAAGHSRPGNGEITKWAIKPDRSIKEPEDETYHYLDMEIVSPAFYFCRESLQAVEDVLALLTSNYCRNVNESTGLHIHVGSGEHSFEFRTLQKL